MKMTSYRTIYVTQLYLDLFSLEEGRGAMESNQGNMADCSENGGQSMIGSLRDWKAMVKQ